MMDIVFFGSNAIKIVDGGWVPLLVAGLVYTVMSTWKHGRTLLAQRLQASTRPLGAFMQKIARDHPTRVPGTAVFLTGRSDGTPLVLMQHLKHNQALHE